MIFGMTQQKRQSYFSGSKPAGRRARADVGVR
jgi:hypothetical protein